MDSYHGCLPTMSGPHRSMYIVRLRRYTLAHGSELGSAVQDPTHRPQCLISVEGRSAVVFGFKAVTPHRVALREELGVGGFMIFDCRVSIGWRLRRGLSTGLDRELHEGRTPIGISSIDASSDRSRVRCRRSLNLMGRHRLCHSIRGCRRREPRSSL